jgi:hypothetical protein
MALARHRTGNPGLAAWANLCRAYGAPRPPQQQLSSRSILLLQRLSSTRTHTLGSHKVSGLSYNERRFATVLNDTYNGKFRRGAF